MAGAHLIRWGAPLIGLILVGRMVEMTEVQMLLEVWGEQE